VADKVAGLLLVGVALMAAAADEVSASWRNWYKQTGTESAKGVTPASRPLRVGRQAVWDLSRSAITDLHGCAGPTDLDCVRGVLERHGAGTEAFDFYRITGWFLTKLRETGGPVMLASVVTPWRANENEQPALVGGKPAVVYPEEVEVSLDDDAGYQALKKRFPRLMFWKPGPTLETHTNTAGGQSFIFRYRLLDGCHACAIRGRARIEFDFASDGTYQRARLLNVVREKQVK
jgi:hypothetical protein